MFELKTTLQYGILVVATGVGSPVEPMRNIMINNKLFTKLAKIGLIDPMSRLMDKQYISICVMKSGFYYACKKGHRDIISYLISLDQLSKKVVSHGLYIAYKNGWTSIVKDELTKCSDNIHDHILRMCYKYKCFELLKLIDISKVDNNLAKTMFLNACKMCEPNMIVPIYRLGCIKFDIIIEEFNKANSVGNVHIAKQLYKCNNNVFRKPKDFISLDVSSKHYYFKEACCNGYIDIVEWIWSLGDIQIDNSLLTFSFRYIWQCKNKIGRLLVQYGYQPDNRERRLTEIQHKIEQPEKIYLDPLSDDDDILLSVGDYYDLIHSEI
jgi:hypothetical protein